MNNQVKLRSSLTRAETLEGLDDVTEMSDAEIARNAEAIRHLATSAHMHITRIGADRDKLKRQLKARPKADTPPVPTIKPGDKEYRCRECKESSSSQEWNASTLKVYGSDIYLIEDDNKAITTLFVCPKCDANLDFRNLEVVECETHGNA
jgi:hypothetical protein